MTKPLQITDKLAAVQRGFIQGLLFCNELDDRIDYFDIKDSETEAARLLKTEVASAVYRFNALANRYLTEEYIRAHYPRITANNVNEERLWIRSGENLYFNLAGVGVGFWDDFTPTKEHPSCPLTAITDQMTSTHGRLDEMHCQAEVVAGEITTAPSGDVL